MKTKKILNCCNTKKTAKRCVRRDGKVFNLPRRFSRKRCVKGPVRGFTMKSSCAPYKHCRKKEFLYNPDNPIKSFDVYIDKNPNDTINIKYKTVDDVKQTIKKLERLFKTKQYSHKRIWQVAMIMKVRLGVIKKRSPKALDIKKRYSLSYNYFTFLKKRTKLRTFKERKCMTFS